MIRHLLLPVIFALAILISPVAVLAAPYGSGKYGTCPYQTSCPVISPPGGTTPTEEPTPGEPVPDTNPEPNQVSSDIDNDGNQEQAIDADGNPANGYEQFSDPDGSSHVLAMTDGEHDGTVAYIIDTNNDGTPDIYWSPSDEYSSDILVRDDETGVAWLYVNSQGQSQVYYVSRNSTLPPVTSSAAPTQERRITPEFFGGSVYEKVGELAKQVPAPVAYSFPYLLLLLIAILIARLIWQTRQEIARLKVVRDTGDREKQLVQEKQNFLMLASHYLRTPLTIIAGNIELLQSLKSIPDSTADKLNSTTSSMRLEAEKLLEELKKNQGLEQITSGHITQQSWVKSLLSPFVIGPLVGLILIILFTNFIFVDFRVTQPRLIDILVQTALVVILVQWFVSSVRKRHINRQNRLDQQRVLDAQRQLDLARSGFIKGATEGLSTQITAFEQQLVSLSAAGTDVSRIQKGFVQLKEIIRKFLFASDLEAAAVVSTKQPFEGATFVDSVVARVQEKAADKKVTIDARAQGGSIVQNQQLLGVVLDSLVDNAIKYSKDQGTVQLGQTINSNLAQFAVQDNGEGLSPQQISALFKPFSRTESAETFNTEGLGFSLYLDKLIMHYLGGDISISSSPGQGTRAELSLPRV